MTLINFYMISMNANKMFQENKNINLMGHHNIDLLTTIQQNNLRFIKYTMWGQLVSRGHFVNMMFFSTDFYISDYDNFLRLCANFFVNVSRHLYAN